MMLAATSLFSFGTFIILGLLTLISTFVCRHTKSATVLTFCCIGLVSAARFVGVSDPVSPAEINQFLPKLPIEQAQLTGRIAQTPAFYNHRSGDTGMWVFSLRCEGIHQSNEWIRKRGRIQVRLTGFEANDPLRQGQRIWLSGELRRRDYPGNEYIEIEASDWKVLSAPVWMEAVMAAQRLRETAAGTLSKGLEDHPTELGIYKALLLGYRKAIPPVIYEKFRQTGTLHIFAISGLHVGIVALLIVVVLKTLGIPRNQWGIWLLPLLLFYVCSTGMKPSALRAWTMAAVYFLAPLVHRKPDVPNAVALAAVLLLWINPLNILSAGFIFSFCVVCFLVMVFSAIPRAMISGGQGIFSSVRTYMSSLGITSGAAFIASVPLTALFFGTFTPVSLLGNLIVVPLTFCIVLCGWLSICIPFLAEVINYAALVFIKGLLGSVGFFAAIPGAHWLIAPPAILAVLIWYVGWITLFTHARTADQRTCSFILVGLAVVMAIL